MQNTAPFKSTSLGQDLEPFCGVGYAQVIYLLVAVNNAQVKSFFGNIYPNEVTVFHN
jgi:hypothetical protein